MAYIQRRKWKEKRLEDWLIEEKKKEQEKEKWKLRRDETSTTA